MAQAKMKVGIIGCGNMGGAIARALSLNHDVSLVDSGKGRAEFLANEIGARSFETCRELAKVSDIVILAVKPAGLNSVAEELSPNLNDKHIIVSVLAATPTETLARAFPECSVVAAMPNTAIQVLKGVLACCDCNQSDDVKNSISKLFDGAAHVVWINETQMPGVTALAGSGPAYAFSVIEAMITAGIAMGLPKPLAEELTCKTIEGSLALMKDGKHPAALRQEICSPGGGTIAGLRTLEAEGVPSGIIETLMSAYKCYIL